ncbi:MAG: glycosyltransferase [Parachlamydiaceae bacterium]|nr:glycosyltransferase [Parachlamydiaceae bacterium]
MTVRFFILLLLFCMSLNGGDSESDIGALKINLFCADRSGLSKDRLILGDALQSLGCTVAFYEIDGNPNAMAADINIFCETLCPTCFSKAPLNWFIPNPEWDWNHDIMNLLKSIDLILCRTHEVQRIFSELKKETFFLGFSSPDHYDATISKNYADFLHLPGTSWQKGTRPILQAWKKNPHFSQLTIVKNSDLGQGIPFNVTWANQWLSEEHLRHLQNSSGVHLCPSETEGFGHYLMEAMSVGAVVVTTDAPPMNEFILDQRCLVPYTSWRFQKLATNFYIDSAGVEEVVTGLMKLSSSELEAIGKKNRKRYLKLKNEFKKNLEQLLRNVKSA